MSLSPVLQEMRTSIKHYWTETPRYVHVVYLVGLGLVLVGLAHGGIWLFVGGSSSGPLSWRKPTTFGVSFGLTTITLGWVASHLRLPRWAGWLGAVLLGVAMSYEVAWAAIQHARGVASHFNSATVLDETLFQLGALAIVVAIVVILGITVAAFLRITAPAPMALAIRAGMISLLTAQATGLWMVLHGIATQEEDIVDDRLTTYGVAGAMKFAHAVPMHGLQVFGVLAWPLGFSLLTQRIQLRWVALAVVGYTGLIGIAIVRTAMGSPPFEPMSISTLFYLVSAGFIAGAGLAALEGLRRRLGPQNRGPE